MRNENSRISSDVVSENENVGSMAQEMKGALIVEINEVCSNTAVRVKGSRFVRASSSSLHRF